MSKNANENYAGVYDQKLGYGEKPALILVDFVQAYFDPDCDLFADVEDALACAIRILDAARSAEIPVVYTNVVYDANGTTGGRFFQKAKPLRNFIEGSPMGAWPSGLSPRNNEIVVSKQYPSAFFGTSLAATLHTLGCDTTLITGLTTSGCVPQRRGYPVSQSQRIDNEEIALRGEIDLYCNASTDAH